MNLYQDLNLARGFAICYADYKDIPSQFHIPKSDFEKGKKLLYELYRVDINHDKIICIFARDHAYLNQIFPDGNWSYHNCRDIDVNVFIESIEYLVNLGYKVFRIGKIALEKVHYEHPNFIDYSFSNGKSDFLDVFLIYVSYFVVGSCAGIIDLSTIFKRPFLNIGQVEPIASCSLFIPKKICSRTLNIEKSNDNPPSSKQKKSFYFPIEIKNLGLQYFEIKKLGLDYIDNTSEEIYLAIEEMLALVENRMQYHENELNLIKRYHEEYWKNFKYSDKLNSPIAVSWLKKYNDLYF